MSSPDLNTAPPADTKGSRRLPTQDEIADETNHVLISLDGTAEKIRKLMKEPGQVTFIRGPVASGKSTLAYYLSEKFPDEFVIVETGTTEEAWLSNLHEAYTGNAIAGPSAAVEAKKVARALQEENKTIIVDEAHNLFGCGNFFTHLTKLWFPKKKVKLLLFSAAGTGFGKDGSHVATPSEITKKYMWYPPIPKGDDLVAQLEEARIFLDGAAVDFLMKICCGHRGLFMMAMKWVKERQENETPGAEVSDAQKWNLNRCVTEVRQSLEESKNSDKRNPGSGWSIGLKSHIMGSRAVKVNGQYDDVQDVPAEIIDVLFGGSRTKSQLNRKERDLTIAGFLVPEQRGATSEFVPYNWGNDSTRYAMANSLMAQYYGDMFSALGYTRTLTDDRPKSGADLLARVLPFVSFTTVINNVIIQEGQLKTPLSPHQLPYEDHYNSALVKILDDLGYSSSQPLNKDGKVDVVASFDDMNLKKKTCAIETIMAHRSIVSLTKGIVAMHLVGVTQI